MHKPIHARRFGMPTLALASALLLGGCAALGAGPGGDSASQAPTTDTGDETAPGVVDSASATPSKSVDTGQKIGPGTLGSQSDGASDAPTAPMANIPPYMHKAAGGPLPGNATPATTFAEGTNGSRYAAFMSPSGNIECLISTTKDAYCTVHSTSSAPAKDANGAPLTRIAVAGKTAPKTTGTVPPPVSAEVKPQVIDYGGMVHYGGVVCASEQSGMTCWDVTSGHGAFLSKQRIQGF